MWQSERQFHACSLSARPWADIDTLTNGKEVAEEGGGVGVVIGGRQAEGKERTEEVPVRDGGRRLTPGTTCGNVEKQSMVKLKGALLDFEQSRKI